MLSIHCHSHINHEKIAKYPERIAKIIPFIGRCNQERINYLSEKDDWKRLEKNTKQLLLMCNLLKNGYISFKT